MHKAHQSLTVNNLIWIVSLAVLVVAVYFQTQVAGGNIKAAYTAFIFVTYRVCYSDIFSNSTSNISVALGGIAPPAPAAP